MGLSREQERELSGALAALDRMAGQAVSPWGTADAQLREWDHLTTAEWCSSQGLSEG
jgi:hypothetical protein